MKLALGTVQFGLNYGVANCQGRVADDEAREIVRLARTHGMDTLDTAMAYGDSEQRLGEIGVSQWQVVSKLPAMPCSCADVDRWVVESVQDSLKRLRVTTLHGLLLHRPDQLLAARGERLYRALERLTADGTVGKIGVSIYDPSELDTLCERFRFDLIQAPFSIMDRRLISTGWLSRLRAAGIELHVRSVFLQGLLLMPSASRPPAFTRWSALWTAYDRWLEHAGLSPLQACIRYALSVPEISKVVVGVDSAGQLAEILGAAAGPVPELPAVLDTSDAELLNPSRWAALG